MKNKNTKTRRQLFFSSLAFIFPTALFVGYALIKVSTDTRDAESNLVSIEILNPFVYRVIGWTIFLAWLALLGASIVSFRKRWLLRPSIGLFTCLLICPFCVALHTLNNLGPWTTHGRASSADGREYVFCDTSFLQGQIMAIGEKTGDGKLKTTFKVLVDNNGDSPRSWASVIRPEGSSDIYGQLYLKNGLLLGIRYHNKCFLAFDIANQKPIGHGDIESIDPFACLSSADVPCELDVERTCDRIKEQTEYCLACEDQRIAKHFLDEESVSGCPSLEILRDAGEGGEFESMAKQILKCYSDAFDKIQSELTLEPNSKPAT